MSQRILIVDDSSAIRFALGLYFKGLGYDVDAAEGLREADAFLDRVGYQLAIVDLSLSGTFGCEGLDLISRIRGRALPAAVILLTAHGSPEMDAEARRRGAATVLYKNVGLGSIAEEVLRLIGPA